MCTGLEPVFLGMGASAGTAAALATGAGALGAGALASKVLQPKMPAINIPTPEKPPQSQAAKAPDRTAVGAGVKAAVAGAPGMGNSGTFLTGPSGIDPASLSLGRNTLLGQ